MRVLLAGLAAAITILTVNVLRPPVPSPETRRGRTACVTA